MLTEFSSYRQRKQRKVNAKMKVLRKAKERKRLSMLPPEYPVEITENCFEVTVKRFINGKASENNYFLTEFGKGFTIWEIISKTKTGAVYNRGSMGQQQAFKLISSDFPRIRRTI